MDETLVHYIDYLANIWFFLNEYGKGCVVRPLIGRGNGEGAKR
jgi:hypothetical protein